MMHCSTRARSGITRSGRHWLWPRGVVGCGNLRVSVDGGTGAAWADLDLWSLSLGDVRIRARGH